MFRFNRSSVIWLVSVAIALLIVVLVSGIGQAQTTGITTRVSVASDGSQGNSASQFPEISADGRYIAFHSSATNLVDGNIDTSTNDVFIHDRNTGETSLVSITSNGMQTNSHSYFPTISADGQFIAFESSAKDLVGNDNDSFNDIFIHDRNTGETSLVSITSDGVSGNGHSQFPSISADGRYVAFMSTAKNFVDNHSNNYLDIFVHDRESGETTIASRASDGTIANGESRWPSISSDGRYVLFQSEATNLVGNDSNSHIDVFMHDRQTGETTLVSVASNGTQGNHDSGLAEISSDGRFIVFESHASNLVENDENNHSKDIFIRNQETGEVMLVSVASNGTQGNQDSRFPSISANGRFITFESFADNLVENDKNGTLPDIFLHDRETGETTLISVASDGTQGNNTLRDAVYGYPSISADGRFITFGSFSSNLVENDTNNTTDVFLYDRGENVSPTPTPSPTPDPSVEYSIMGKVVNEDGSAAAGVIIKVGEQTLTTGADGSYSINVNVGEYIVEPNMSDTTFTTYPVSRTVTVDNNLSVDSFTMYPCLSPHTSLNVCELEIGDIIVQRGGLGSSSVLARNAIATYWWHAQIYIGNGEISHAVGQQENPNDDVIVQSIFTASPWLGASSYDWAVIRPTTSLQVKHQAAKYAREKAEQTNPPTSYVDTSGAGIGELPALFAASRDIEDEVYCSELVWKAYEKQGLNLEVNRGANFFSENIKNIVAADDLFYSAEAGLSTIPQQNPSMSNRRRALYYLLSPADLLITDSQGQKVGYNPSTGQGFSEIPGSYHSGPDTEPETISFAAPLEEDYTLEVVGTGTGEFTVLAMVSGETLFLDSVTNTISPGEKFVYTLSPSADDEVEVIQPKNKNTGTIYLPLIVR